MQLAQSPTQLHGCLPWCPSTLPAATPLLPPCPLPHLQCCHLCRCCGLALASCVPLQARLLGQLHGLTDVAIHLGWAGVGVWVGGGWLVPKGTKANDRQQPAPP